MVRKQKVLVIDGQGGGIGKTIVSRLQKDISDLHIIAVGTNHVATKAMCLAGANEGHTGEEAIISHCESVDMIIGVIGLLIPNGLKGELTHRMVDAVVHSEAMKFLVPMNRCNVKVAMQFEPLSQHIDDLIALVKAEVENEKYNQTKKIEN